MAKEVAKAGSTEVSTIDAASLLDEFAGAGFGDVSASDFNIPRIGIIGDLSPQIKKNDAAYIEGAEPGHIVDVGMAQLFKTGIEFLPVARVKEWIRWAPRKTGQGILDRYDFDYIKENNLERNERNEYLEKDGSEVIETWQFYGLNLSAGGRRSFLPMKKSNLKIARRWFGQMREERLPNGNIAPLFFNTWNLGSFSDSGNGNTWWNWTVAKGTPILQLEARDRVVADAVDFLKQIEAGSVQGLDEREDHGVAKEEVPF
jgi:hypothetical protein